jgi:hypothetical protein
LDSDRAVLIWLGHGKSSVVDPMALVAYWFVLDKNLIATI